jgi:hypothetical protein
MQEENLNVASEINLKIFKNSVPNLTERTQFFRYKVLQLDAVLENTFYYENRKKEVSTLWVKRRVF